MIMLSSVITQSRPANHQPTASDPWTNSSLCNDSFKHRSQTCPEFGLRSARGHSNTNREADKLIVGLTPSGIQGTTGHSISVTNARKQNRGQQRRLKDELNKLDEEFRLQTERISAEQKSIVEELLQKYPHLEKQLTFVFRDNPELLRKLGLPKFRVHRKVLNVYVPELDLSGSQSNRTSDRARTAEEKRVRERCLASAFRCKPIPVHEADLPLIKKRYHSSLDPTDFTSSNMKNKTTLASSPRSTGINAYTGPKSLQLTGMTYFEPQKYGAMPQNLTPLTTKNKTTAPKVSKKTETASKDKEECVESKENHKNATQQTDPTEETMQEKQTPPVLPCKSERNSSFVFKRASTTLEPIQERSQPSVMTASAHPSASDVGEPLGPYALAFRVSHFVDTDFGFSRDKAKPSAGMSLRKTISGERDLQREIANTAQRHIYTCQIPRARGSKAEENILNLKDTLFPRGQGSWTERYATPRDDLLLNDPKQRHRRLELQIGALSKCSQPVNHLSQLNLPSEHQARLHRGTLTPRRDNAPVTTSMSYDLVKPRILPVSPGHRK